MKRLIALAAGVLLLAGLVAAQSPSRSDARVTDLPGYEMKSEQFTVAANDVTSRGISCSTGNKPLGGGYTTAGSQNPDVMVTDSAPTTSGWVMSVRNGSAVQTSAQIFVTCAAVGS